MVKIGAALVAALLAIAFGKILLLMSGRFLRFWVKLPILAKVILPAVLTVFYLHGSIKNRGTFSLRPVNVATVTDIDIGRGFKLESVVTNAAYSYELASNAVRNAAWHLAGGHSAFNRYNLGWSFPMGENTYDHIIAFQEGSVFHNPRDEHPLFKLYDGVLSFVPGYSDFWTLIDDKRGVFTWHNVMPYDKTNEVVSVQLELINNGDFTIRSNELQNVYWRINLDDWDNDGLANEVDNAPKSYDGDFFGVASPLPEGALESAYCWVDLCVTGVTDTATVRVTCDGPSDLGDQVIIARTNEVFRVPLLKGAYYDVESTLPMFVVDQSSDNIDIWCNDCWFYHSPSASHRYLSVSYYVDFWLENNGNLCELKSSENIGAAVSDVTGACCKSDITPLGFRWCCNASCNCGGDHEHYLNGLVSWEGYTAYLGSSVYCTCMAGDAVETDGGAKISVSFKNDVIIFENTYTNSQNDIVSSKSTINTLGVSAYGGQYGGVIELDMEGDDGRLAWHDGDIFISPIEIAAGERIELRIDYTAYKRSLAKNDIKARMRFVENFTGAIVSDEDTMTAVQVEVEPLVTIGKFFNRHIVGIGENVICRVYPRQVQWGINFNTNTFGPNEYNEVRFDSPFNEVDNFLKFTVLDTEFASAFKVVEPNGVCVRNGRELLYSDAVVNKAGWVGMVLDLVVLPTNVCFSALHIMEVPEDKDKIVPVGYFSGEEFSAIWHHTEEMGAGVWHRVQRDNHFLNDEARCGEGLPDNWSNGQITWKIPVAWGRIENGYEECRQNEFGEPYYQIFRMSSNGTLRVIKFDDYWVERTSQGVRTRSDNVEEGLL